MNHELLTRGVERIYPSAEALEKELASGRKLRIYFGIDPTGPSLHLGHAVNLLKLREFQDLGHEIIFLIGDFTALIGDPTDKAAARVKLTPAQVKENLKPYLTQAGKILDLSKTQVRYNSEWLAKLNLAELLELASHLTFAQIIKRDMFQKRLSENKDLFLHEFLYPLMQGYDSVVLETDIELGGNDQIFNMLVGRDLLKSLKSKEKFVVAMKLLTDPSGKKMGKTEGNLVALDAAPAEIYGKVMSWPDELLPLGFELLTRLPVYRPGLPLDNELTELIGHDPKAAKMRLAREIVGWCHNAEAAAAAEAQFVQTFQNRAAAAETFEEIPVAIGARLAEVLVAAKVVESKTELRRLFRAGAVENLDGGEKVSDPDTVVSGSLRLRVGKKRFVRLVPR